VARRELEQLLRRVVRRVRVSEREAGVQEGEQQARVARVQAQPGLQRQPGGGEAAQLEREGAQAVPGE
jgi:hypothetical protein